MKKILLGLIAFSLFTQAFAAGDCRVWVNNQLPLMVSTKKAIESNLAQGLEAKGYVMSDTADAGFVLNLYRDNKKSKILAQLFDMSEDAQQLLAEEMIADKGTKIIEKTNKKIDEIRKWQLVTAEDYYWYDVEFEETEKKGKMKFTNARTNEIEKILSKLPHCMN